MAALFLRGRPRNCLLKSGKLWYDERISIRALHMHLISGGA